MNKLPLRTFLALFIFAVSTTLIQSHHPHNSPSHWHMLVNFIFGDQQSHSQDNSDRAPEGITIQDYLIQFRYDLNGTSSTRTPIIPWHEVEEMENALTQELRSIDLRNTEKTNCIIRTVLLNHVKKQTLLDLQHLQREGFYIAPEDYRSIPNSHEYNILSRLGRSPHLNGESIAQYFGESRKHATKDALFNRHHNHHPFNSSTDVYP